MAALPLTPEVLRRIGERRAWFHALRDEVSDLTRIRIELSEGVWLAGWVDDPDDNHYPETFLQAREKEEPMLIDMSAVASVERIGYEGLYLEMHEHWMCLIAEPGETKAHVFSDAIPEDLLQWARLYWASEQEIPARFAELARMAPHSALQVLEQGLVLPEAPRESIRQVGPHLSPDALAPLLSHEQRGIREHAALLVGRIGVAARTKRPAHTR